MKHACMGWMLWVLVGCTESTNNQHTPPVTAGSMSSIAAGSGGAANIPGSCQAHRDETRAFIDQHRACRLDIDCALVGACSGGFGFEAVSRSATTAAQALSDATSSECAQHDGPLFRTVCDRGSGQCVLENTGEACGEAPDPGQICDGSDGFRLGYNNDGGQVESSYAFTNPYGHSFLLVDGHCNYYVSDRYMRGMFTGQLTGEQAAQLANQLHYSKLQAWAGHFGDACPDAGGATLSSPDAAVSCSCGCKGADPGVDTVMGRMGDVQTHLIAQGKPWAGELSALAYSGADRMLKRYDWPLARKPTAIPELVDTTRAYGNQGAAFSDSTEITALRELRARCLLSDARAEQIPIVVSPDESYQLFVRDDLPAPLAAAAKQFFESATKR